MPTAKTAALLLLLTVCLFVLASIFSTLLPHAHAQKPAVPRRGTKTVDGTRAINLKPSRPGNYSFWLNTRQGAALISSIVPTQQSVPLSLPATARQIVVVDDSSGTVALYDTKSLRNGATLTIDPQNFKRVRSVIVSVLSGGRPVEKAIVVLQEDQTKTVQRFVLTAVDEGKCRFQNVLIGQVTATASYGRETTIGKAPIAPGKAGRPAEINLQLPEGVVPVLDRISQPTVAADGAGSTGVGGQSANANGQTTATGASGAAQTTPPSAAPNNGNPLGVGLITLPILVGLGFYGWREARKRGVTVDSLLTGLKVLRADDEQETPRRTHLQPSANPNRNESPLELLSGQPLPNKHGLPDGAIADPMFGTPNVPGAANGVPVIVGPQLLGTKGGLVGQRFALPIEPGDLFLIGRGDENQIALPRDSTVSRTHAKIEAAGGGYQIEDVGSANGTYVNGARTIRQTLQHGDTIQVGESRFTFET